jgi:hypothetical protein
MDGCEEGGERLVRSRFLLFLLFYPSPFPFPSPFRLLPFPFSVPSPPLSLLRSASPPFPSPYRLLHTADVDFRTGSSALSPASTAPTSCRTTNSSLCKPSLVSCSQVAMPDPPASSLPSSTPVSRSLKIWVSIAFRLTSNGKQRLRVDRLGLGERV